MRPSLAGRGLPKPSHGLPNEPTVMKLNATSLRSLTLPRGKKDHIAWDDDIPGFGVRLREGGSAGFVFQYQIGAKQRRMSLGAISAVRA